MAAELFFAVKSIGLSRVGGRKPATLISAARHNMRTEQNERGARENIDPALSHLNEHLRGPATPEGVAALAQSVMASHGVAVDKLRRDYAQAIEVVCSLPAGTTIDTGRYFADCVAWIEGEFGGENILSADIHRDEPAPHCHVLILPMAGGRWVGSGLVAREKLTKLRAGFFRDVGNRYGLRKQERMDGAMRGAMVAAVLERMNAARDPAMKSPAWAAIREAIERDPRGFARALDVEVAAPQKKLRTRAQIFTSKGRGAGDSNPIGFGSGGQDLNPIGLQGKKERTLSCVGFDNSTASIPSDSPTKAGERGEAPPASTSTASTTGASTASKPGTGRRDMGEGVAWAPARPAPEPAPAPAPTPAGIDDGEGVTRVRDADMEPGQWCEELGEWVAAPAPKPKGRRAAADEWVADALESVRRH